MSKRAVTYARVSGDDRSKDSRNLTGQLDMCREFAQTRGYQIIAELAEDDRGASGASFELEQLGKMLEMARNHEFNVLIVREIDRLSRNLAKQLIVEEELKRSGVSIEYVLGEYPDTPEGNLMKHVRAVVAEYEREKIRERIERGKFLKIISGSVMTNGINRPPYGYKVIKVENKWALEIYEAEAKIVRMIFSWYAHGDNGNRMTIRGITRKLSQMQIPTRMDTGIQKGGHKLRPYGEWSEGQIAKILGGDVYRGEWQYGKRGSNGKGRGKHLLTVNVPPIIDNETWLLAQRKREINRMEAERNRKYKYLLAGHIRCSACGSSVNGESNCGDKVRLYYRCKATHRGNIANVKCNMPLFRVETIDNAVWNWLRKLISDPEALQAGLDARMKESENHVVPLCERLEVINKLLADNQVQLDRLLELYLTGDFHKEMLIERKKRLEMTIQSLENERFALTEMIDKQSITASQIQNAFEFTEQVCQGMELAEDDFQAKRDLLEILEVQARIGFENNEKVLYVRCLLGENRFGVMSTTTCNDRVHRSTLLPRPRSRTAG